MTLVAAFKIDGVPALLGDFLITDNVKRTNDFLPTMTKNDPKAPGSMPFDGAGRIAGWCRKITKINDNFVVGFTGEMKPGTSLIRNLHRVFADRKITKQELEAFLSNVNIPKKSSVQLIGWICGKRQLCFDWNGKTNKLKIVESAFAGSGAKHFRSLIEQRRDEGGSHIKTAFERAKFVCVNRIGHIISDELRTLNTLKNSYGFGGECMVWNGKSFVYIDNITYSFYNVEFRQNNVITWGIVEIMCKYKDWGDHCVFEVTQFDVCDVTNTFKPVVTYGHFVSSLLGSKAVEHVRLPNSFDYLFVNMSISIEASGINIPMNMVHVSENDENVVFKKDDNGILFRPDVLKKHIPAKYFQ